MKAMGLRVFLVLLGFWVLVTGCQSRKGDSSASDADLSEASSQVAGVGPRVFFRNLNEGDVVQSPFVVEMGVEGIELEPAGEVREGYGHHHILINQTYWPNGEVIPQSDTTMHYGQAEKEATLTLSPGEYTLALQFADGVHASYGEALSATVRIRVSE